MMSKTVSDDLDVTDVSKKDDSEDQVRPVSKRAAIIGLLVVAVLASINIRALYTEEYPPLGLGDEVPPLSAMALLFVMMLVNCVLKRFNRVFKKSEMIAVYSMVSIGAFTLGVAAVAVFPFIMQGLPILSQSQPELYLDYYEKLSPLIQPQSDEATWGFQIGSSSVPWGEWLMPIILWTIFFGVVLFVFLCLGSLIRHHWENLERLTYPITVPVQSMIEEKSRFGGQTGSIWNNKLLYIGFIYPLIFTVPGIIQKYFAPWFPTIIPSPVYLSKFLVEYPFHVLQNGPAFAITFNPLAIGIGYIVSLEVSFSIWLFYLLQYVARILIFIFTNAYDTGTGFPFYFGQTVPAMFGFGLFSVWIARHSIRDAVKMAFSKSEDLSFGRNNEGFSPRVMVWGTLLGFVFIVGFARILLHLPVLVTSVYFLVFFVGTLGYCRLRAEGGVPYSAAFPYYASSVAYSLGKDVYGPNWVGMGWFWSMEWGSWSGAAALGMESYKLAGQNKINRKSISVLLLAAFVVAMIAGFVVALPIIYEKGIYMVSSNWSVHGYHYAFTHVASYGAKPHPAAVPVAIISIAISLLLQYLRTLYIWFPLHPVGYILSTMPQIPWYWGGFFIAWIIKSLVYKYGGHSTITKLYPIFIGFIVGDIVLQLVTVLLGLVL